jgi:hypothetical protein
MWVENILSTEGIEMYLAYDVKNGVEYAKLVKSTRKGKRIEKEYTNLGRVIDKELGIYKNRARGIYQYDLANDYYDDNPSWEGSSAPIEYSATKKSGSKEKCILDFGDSFFLDSYLKSSGLDKVIEGTSFDNNDTAKAMLCYYILSNTANCHAETWFNGNYASKLYPNAKLKSQRISEFLASCGSEEVYRSFFKLYYPFISGGHSDGENILIDSTGLPNNIHFPVTAISNHNGKISNEVRLIYVTQQETGLPIYFRYCPGNVIDVSTLVSTIKELKQNGVNTKFAILDAGYYSEDNVRRLYQNKISFMTRLPEKLNLYKNLLKDNLDGIQKKENFVNYNDRYLYVKCVEIADVVDGNKGYGYIGLDIMRKSDEDRKLFGRARDNKLAAEEVYEKMGQHGVFIILSSRRIAVDKILPTYYTRQQIEQVFDIGKNYADMLPLRVQNEDTFRGHLLLTFISCIILKLIQEKLLKTKYNPVSMFMNLRNQKCKVYENVTIPTEATKKMNDCYKLFKINCPVEITRPCG